MNKVFISCLIIATTVFSSSSFAHETNGDAKESITVLQQQALPDAAGKNVMMITVNYTPGQSSEAHRHPGSVFAYVLEGEVTSQVQGQAAKTYKAGEYWYEAPKVPHIVSKNASSTKPAKLLVWLMVNEGEKLKMPLEK